MSQARSEATKDEATEICSATSEQDSVPENHSICVESDHSLTPKNLSTDSSSSIRSTKELNPHLSLDVSDLEAATNRQLSSCEEGTVQSSHDQDTKEQEQLKSTTAECTYAAREETVTQRAHKNAESSAAESSVLLLNNQTGHLDVYQNREQAPCTSGERISIPTATASSRENGIESASGGFENRLAAFQKERFALQLEIKQLEEQLKQSEEEKQKLSVELGKFLFLEDKEKRRGRLLGGAASLHDPGKSARNRNCSL